MTAKMAFEYALVELNKREAPSLLLEDYNYFFNKAVNQFINRMYNAYEINQQKTDDLRVLKGTAVLEPLPIDNATSTSTLYNKTYEVSLPDDYLHVLNCIVEYDVKKTYKCYNSGDTWQQGAKRLTADMFGQILNNYYLRPSYKNPYYYINNVNVDNTFPTTNDLVDVQANKYSIAVTQADVTTATKVLIKKLDNTEVLVTATAADTATLLAGRIDTAFGSTITTVSGTSILVDKGSVSELSVSGPGVSLSSTPDETNAPTTRYGNKSKVRLEIRYGKDNSTFELKSVFIDYLKTPQFIRLTQTQVDEIEDNSQLLEFPDYVCQEIVNELIKLLLENASDPRLQSHIPINQSIAMPGQEQPRK